MTHTPPPEARAGALALTVSPKLATHLRQLHPAVRPLVLTRLAGIGTLPDADALLILSHPDQDQQPTDARPARPRHSRTVYVGTDLDDAGVWARAVRLHATAVLFTPSDDHALAELINQHLHGPA